MAACSICDLCPEGISREDALEVVRVPCNVRRHHHQIFTLWRCRGCGSLHCEEEADLPAFYDQYPLQNQKLSFSEKVGYRNRLRILSRHGLRPESRILDYGCGAGLFVEYLRGRQFPQVFGYDAFVPRFQDRRVLDRPYDTVVSYDVIEHYDDPREFMATVTGMVRPGGMLTVGTPNADGVPIHRTGDPNLHVPYHRHILSERVLLELGREAGLEVQSVYRRSFYDSLIPTVNSRFMWTYIARAGGLLDAAVEPPRLGLILTRPELVFLAFFGYFFPLGDNMLVTFRKPQTT